jgi:hypothetical protein
MRYTLDDGSTLETSERLRLGDELRPFPAPPWRELRNRLRWCWSHKRLRLFPLAKIVKTTSTTGER